MTVTHLRWRPSLLLLAFFLIAITGCAQTAALRGGIATAEHRLAQVEANGAYSCAPKELALAQAHLRFAQLEIQQGMGSRATYHYNILMENLNLAEEKSPASECAGVSVVVTAPFTPFVPTEEPPPPTPEDPDSDGDGIPDSIDQCPLDPEDFDGFQDHDGCPDIDNDMDGIPDYRDDCPNEPEDPDGFQDEDGCPDPDNDGDGVPDLEDECPNTPGPASNQGCPLPQYEGVVITESRIEINQTIHFATNKATIRPISFTILNTVAQVLEDNPTITLSIEGHTDSRGRAAYNKKLSHQRADSVKNYLIKRGVARNRLTSVGFGLERPIDTNQTEEGRAANRRVEFVRTDSAN